MTVKHFRLSGFILVTICLYSYAFLAFAADNLPLDSFVLYAKKEVKLNKTADSAGHVGSNGRIQIQKGKCERLQGDLRALDKIENKGEITIDGNVHSNKKIHDKGTLTVLGSMIEGANLSELTLPSPSFSAGGPRVELPKHGSETLDAGSYGKVKVKEYAELHLSSGDYYMEELKTHHHATILIDLSGGPITINVKKKLDIDDFAEIRIDPGGWGTTRDITINALEKGTITIKKGAIVRGTLVAPHAKVKFKHESQLEGAVYAEKISLDKGVSFRRTAISMEITSPNVDDTISRSDIVITGTIINTTGNETAVTVNGILAIVEDDKFVANHVPLEEGENTITATATDTEGNTSTTSININAITTGDYIILSHDKESGISPLEATLTVEGSFSFTESTLTYTGPGQVEFLESTPEEYRVRMTTEGVYSFVVEVTDAQDNIHTNTVAIQVLDAAELDALLKEKWEGMREALAQNDIDSAVANFDDSLRDAFRETFTVLSSLLPQISQELRDVQFIRMMKNSVEYDIRTIRDGKEYSFYVLFIRDKHGLWKIRSF